MWKNNKTNKLSYFAWSCVFHITAFVIIIISPNTEKEESQKIEITFQVAGNGINVGSRKGESLRSKNTQSASTKNALNDSLLSELESKVSKGAAKHQAKQILATKAKSTIKTNRLKNSGLSNNSKAPAPAKETVATETVAEAKEFKKLAAAAAAAVEEAQEDVAQKDFAAESQQEPQQDSSLEKELNTDVAETKESGLRNLVKKSAVAVPRKQILGKKRFKSARKSAFGSRKSSVRKNTLGSRNAKASARKSAFGSRNAKTSARKNAFGDRKNTNRKSAFGSRSAKNSARKSAFGSRKSTGRTGGAFGNKNRLGRSRKGSAFGRANGQGAQNRRANAFGRKKGSKVRASGNAFGRGGAGSKNTFGLLKGFKDARGLRQKAGNPIPKYPYQDRLKKNQGTVYLVYWVTAFGTVSKIKIHTSSGSRSLDKAATKAIAKYKYYRGQAGYVIHPVEFKIQGTAKL